MATKPETMEIIIMKKILIILICCLLIAGCSLFQIRRTDIQQGNIYTQEMVSQLHTGMTFAEVKHIMGSPVLLNTFSDNRVDYVYTFKTGGKIVREKYVTLTFYKGRLEHVTRFGI